MTATAYRASRITRSRRLSLMRGASWLPLAAIAMVSYAKDARAQAVNLGGMQARMPAQPQARATVPAGVQQSPGNNIVTDGQTATNVRVNGNTTTITTQTMSGGNAFNSFKTFSAAEGNTVNLIVPDQAGKLVNIVREGQVNIQGTLNSYQNGRIGGNVVFADSYGLVVGAKGSVNVGSLTVVTPNKSTIDAMIVNGKVNDGVVARVVTGDVPLSPDGSVVINGRVNATHAIKITATDVKIAGSLEAAKRAAEQKAQFAATVNTRGWKGGGQLVAHGGSISISGANSVSISGAVRAGSGRGGAGSIGVASGKSVQVTGSLKAEGGAGRNGGKINVTSGGDITIGSSAKMSVAGNGKNSSAGEIVVKASNNLSVADGAAFDARGGKSGDGGFVELSAVKTVTLGNIDLQLAATAGKAGTLLIDPEELIIGAGNKPALRADGNIVLQANKTITVLDGGVIDTTVGNGWVLIDAPTIKLLGGARIASLGSVTLTSNTPTSAAVIAIGDDSGKRVTIDAKDLIIAANATATDSKATASVTVINADITLTGKIDVQAQAIVNKTVSFVGAVADTTTVATVDVLDGAKIKAASAALQAIASTTVTATAAPNALSTKVGDVAASVIKAESTSRVNIGKDAEVTTTSATGALELNAKNTVVSTSTADASSSQAAGASVAVNILKVDTSALIDGEAKVTAAGTLTVAATTSVAAITKASASAQGAGEAGSGSNANEYLTDKDYKAYASDDGVKAAGALAIAGLTSSTTAQMASKNQATVTGATLIRSVTGNASSVVADGSSATGSNGVGAAIGINLSKISNQSLLDQKISSGALDVSATMTGTAADNAFSVTATSGAAASNVGVAGAMATNLLDSESLARMRGEAILNGNRLSVTASDLTSATALAGPSGADGTKGDKIGIGASVALNLVATRAIAELADGATVTTASDVALKATGEHVLTTKAEQGAEGGVAVTPVSALTMASDRTRASIGLLAGGLIATGDVTVEAVQRTTALTEASGTAAGGKAGIGAALTVAVLDEQTIATTSSHISTAGAVSFTAKGAALVATAAVASASGGKETDSDGNSTDGDATADAKITKATDDASVKQGKAGVGKPDQQAATKAAAESGKDQGKTSDGSVAVAAAIGATLLDAKVQAYVPAAVGIRSGALSITSIANADARTTADGSAVGSKDATAKVGVGVGLSLNLVRLSNDALLGIGSPLSSGTVNVISGITAGQYSVTSLALKAAQDDLGAKAPVVTVKSPAAVDAAKLAKASIAASSGQLLNTFESNASAGAGASSVGVAGAVALNLVDTQSSAKVGGAASVLVRNSGAIMLTSGNESSLVARAMPAGSGAAGEKVGVGASVALNLVATRSTAELQDDATIKDAGDVTLQAAGVHGVVTQAEQGSKGGVSVTPVIALTMASDWTRASIGALNGGLDASGDISITAIQRSNALTQASGTAAGDKAGIGAALAASVLDEQVTATTASSIRTAGAVRFTADGATAVATAAVASASGGNSTDDSGKSKDKDATADAKIQKETAVASAKQEKAKIGTDDQRTGSVKAAKSQDDQGKTNDGSVAVAAAIATTVLQSTVQAYVPAAVGVKSGALSLTANSNADARTTADGSAVGSKDATATVGVGVGLALNLVRSGNDAVLGDATPLLKTGAITGVTAGTYDVTKLTLKAAQDERGVTAPVATAKSPVAVDAAKLAKATIAASTGQHLNVFEVNASAGAGASNVGVAGAVALNLVDTQSKAQVAGGVTVIANDGAIKLTSDNESSIIARAMPAGIGASGDKVGVGAAAAINLAATRSTAELASDARITGAHDVTLQATGVHGVVTQAEQGSKGGVAVTPVVATTLVSNRTQALIGALVGGLTAGGDVTVAAQQRSSALTQASGTAAGGKAAVGAALAVAVLDEQTIATTASSIKAGGAVSFSAKGASLAATAAMASASGGNGTDDAGKSTDKDGSVDQKVQAQSSKNSDRMADAKIGDDKQQASVKAGGSQADGKAKTDEGGVAVAAAIAVDVSLVAVKAYVPSSVGVDAKGALSVTSVANVDAMTSADGSASAATGAGSGETKVGVGAAVAVNVVIADNIAELGTKTAASAKGQITGVNAGYYGASDLTVSALKTDLGTKSPVVLGGMAIPEPDSATTSLGRLDQIITQAKSGASGAKVGVAGSLAVNVLLGKSAASVAEGAVVTIDPQTQTGAVTIAADNEAYVAARSLAWQDGKGAKVGVGASVAFNYATSSSAATLAKNADITGATALTVTADHRLDTYAFSEAGAKGGTALDAVVAVSILDVKTAASIASGTSALTVDGDVTVRASSVGSHEATATGSATSSGGGTAIGGAVALITGTGLFDPQLWTGKGRPIGIDVSASVARDITADSLALTAEGRHVYAAAATATASGGNPGDVGAEGGSKSTSSQTLGSAPAQDAMDKEQNGLKDNGKGNADSGGKLSVAAAVGAVITGDSVKASIADNVTLTLDHDLTVKAISRDQVQALGNAASVSTQQDNGIGIGAALAVVANKTEASIGNSVHIHAGGAVTAAATSELNNGLGGFMAEAMSGASGKKLAVAGALAIGVSASSTDATIGNNVSIGGKVTANPAGAVSVTVTNTSSLAAKAWSGSYSGEGYGIGASIAAAISNDRYTASIGNDVIINAASVDVSATNVRVDDVFSSLRALAQPIGGLVSDVNNTVQDRLDATGKLIGSVNSAAAAKDAVTTFKTDFAKDIAAAKDKILGQLKSTGQQALDLPLLGSNNFYTEVVAGAASASKLAVSGGLALQLMLRNTKASIGTGASIDATGKVGVSAQDNAISRTIVGALAGSGGQSAAGISLGIIVNSGQVDALIGAGSKINQSGSINLAAGADHNIDLFEMSAAAANANGVAGILGFVYSGAAVTAKADTGTTLNAAGLLNVEANNTVNTLNLAGGVAAGGNNGIGGVIISTNINNKATARIDSAANAVTTVDAGSVRVAAITSERLINVAVAGAGAGSNAIAGVATPLLQILTVDAGIGANADVTARTGGVAVQASDNTLLVNVAGVLTIGGSNGVGGSAAASIIKDTIKAEIANGATLTAAGSVDVVAKAKETVVDVVVSGAGGGNVGVAVALASSTLVNNVSARIGTDAHITTTDSNSTVGVVADDTTLIVDLAGSVGAASGTGVGAGADVNVLTKNTSALIDDRTTVKAAGDVVVQATSSENVFSAVAGFGIGGDSGAAGSVATFVLAGKTFATMGGANITADGNVGVFAYDTNELNRIVGSIASGSNAGVGGSIGVSVIDQETRALIRDGAKVTALGKTSGKLKVTTGIAGSFGTYLDDVLSVRPGRSDLDGKLTGDIDPETIEDGAKAGGSLLVLQRTTKPIVEEVHGVAVAASNTSLLRSVAISGAGAGNGAVTMSGDLPVVISTTDARIGKGANINEINTGAGAEQSVIVAASSDLYHLGVSGSGALAGTAGVGAGAETAIFHNDTHASVGVDALINATRDVAVTARASENFAGMAASLGGGGNVGVSGALTGVVVISKTSAAIESAVATATRVNAGGNVSVLADDQTRAVLIGGTIAIGGGVAGVGMGVGFGVVVKETSADIGAGAKVNALGNGGEYDQYVGTDFSSTRKGRGLLVQANSGQAIMGVVTAGGGGAYAGVAGAVAAEIFVTQTRANIGDNAVINGDNAGANAAQDVAVIARSSTVVQMAGVVASGGLAGVGGAVDVAVLAESNGAKIGDGAEVHARHDVSVNALTNRQTLSTVASFAGGLASVSGSISVLAIADKPDSDQSSKMNSSGSFNDNAKRQLSDDTVDSKFLASSTNDDVKAASTKAQKYKTDLSLAPVRPAGFAPGNSATIGTATVKADGSVNVRAFDQVNAKIVDGTAAIGISAGAGVAVGVVTTTNTALANGAKITAGALDVTAMSKRSMDGYSLAASASGGAGAFVSLTDTTTTAATVTGAKVTTNAGAKIHAENNETFIVGTAGGASGVAGGLGLIVAKPTTSANLDGKSVIDAATTKNGAVEISAANSMDITSVVAGLNVGAGGGVGLSVITELGKSTAQVGDDSTINAGSLANATAGDVVVSATTTDKVFSTGAGIALGDGLGGALTVLVRDESTTADIKKATIFATGNVAVTANAYNAADLLIGGVAVGGGVGVGGSLGVTVLNSTVRASIASGADVTALGLGNALPYIKAYQTSFSDYLSGDKFKPGSLNDLRSDAKDVLLPETTDDVAKLGSYLLLKQGSIDATMDSARGVIVNAASGQSVRSVVAAGAGSLGVSVGLSGNVPVVLANTTANIGSGAFINQKETGSAGANQSVVVAATSDIYSLNVVGSAGLGGVAGVGASLSTAVINNNTTASIDANAKVAARNNVAVTALAGEDVAMIAAAGSFGGYAGVAGGLSLIAIENKTTAIIRSNAEVYADNNVAVVANDSTRAATFAGSVGVGAFGGGVGTAVSVGLVNKTTQATIDNNAKVAGRAKGSDTFRALTASSLTDTLARQGVLVSADSVESTYVFSIGGGAGAFVAAAGAITVDVFNTNTYATINSGAKINQGADGDANQDVVVQARDLAGIVSKNFGVAGSGLVSLSGAVDVGVLNTNVGASIGDATVTAKRDVLVTALANKAIDSTVVSGSAAALAFTAGVSVYSIGDGFSPGERALSELQTPSGSGSVTDFAGSKLSVGGQLGNMATGTAATGNTKGSSSSEVTSQASYASGKLGDKLGSLNVSNAIASKNAAVAGTSATIGNANIKAGGAVSLNGSDQVAYKAETGIFSVSAIGAGAGIGILTNKSTNTATITGGNGMTGLIDAGSVSVIASTIHTATINSYAGSAALGAALQVDVAILEDRSVTKAGIYNYKVSGANSVTVSAGSKRQLTAKARGAAVGLIAAAGASVAKATVGGSVDAELKDVNLGASKAVGAVTVQATSKDTADAYALAGSGGIFGSGSGADSTATVSLPVNATLSNATINATGLVTLLGKAENDATATSDGFTVAGGLSIGASIANASLSPTVRVTVTGGDITADALQVDAQALSTGAKAKANAAAGAILASFSATEANATDNSKAIADSNGGKMTITNALAFNAVGNGTAKATANGVVVGIVVRGSNDATATANTRAQATFSDMSYLGGGSIAISATGTNTTGASSVAGGGAFVGGASARATTDSTSVTIADITRAVKSPIVNDVQTIDVEAKKGELSIRAQHTDIFAGTVDSSLAAVAGLSGARLTQTVDSSVSAGLGTNVTASARTLTIDASNVIKRYFVCEIGCGIAAGSVDLMGWDVKAGAGGFLNGAAAIGDTTVTASTWAGIGDESSVRLLLPTLASGLNVSTANINASNDITVHQKTRVQALGAIQQPRGDSNVNVDAFATVGFGQGSKLVVDIGDVKAAAWSNIDVDARTSVTTNAAAGAADGAAKAYVTSNSTLLLDKNALVQVTSGLIPTDGSLATNGSVTLMAGRNGDNKPAVLKVNTVVDVYNESLIPYSTKPDAVSDLASNATLSVEAPDAGRTGGVRAAGDIGAFADQGQMTTSATGTGKDVYRDAGSKILSFFSKLVGGGDISLDIKGGTTSQKGASLLVIDGIVETGIARTKELKLTYGPAGCAFLSPTDCIVATGNITIKEKGTFQAGGAILDRLGQINALLDLYKDDLIAKAAYLSEKTFLLDKLVTLGLATKDNAGVVTLNKDVTVGVPVGADTAALKSLSDALGTFQSQMTTDIGTVISVNLANIALSWNGTKLDRTTDTGAETYAFAKSAENTLEAYKDLSNYRTLTNNVSTPEAKSFQDTIVLVRNDIAAGSSSLNSAILALDTVKNAASSLSEVIRSIVSTQQDVAQGLKKFAAVETKLEQGFAGVTAQQKIITDNNTLLESAVHDVQSYANKITSNLGILQTAASNGSAHDTGIIAGLNVALAADKSNLSAAGAQTLMKSSSDYINVQVKGGDLSAVDKDGKTVKFAVKGLETVISDYATSLSSGKSVDAWKTDLNAKSQEAAKYTAGSVGRDSAYIEIADTAVQLGNIYLGAGTVKTSTGDGQIKAPGNASITVVNETAATLKFNNLTIPINNAGRILVNNAEVTSAAGIDAVTGKPSAFKQTNVVTSGGRSTGTVTIESRYDPESVTYYKPNPSASDPKWITTQQMAPDVILQAGKTIYNPAGDVSINSAAGNIYLYGNISAGSVSIVARNGDMVSSYVNGFNHTGGDPATKTLSQGSAITAGDSIASGIGIVANGQVFLAARYLNINSTVQSGVAEWKLEITKDSMLVTKDVSKITGVADLTDSDVATRMAKYISDVGDGKKPDTTFDYYLDNATKDPKTKITLDLATGQLSFSIATVDALNLKAAFKFADTTSSSKPDGIYRAQAGASYDGDSKQVVVDGTSVRGGYIKIFGQIINTSASGASLNVLDGFGTINITNDLNLPVVLQTLNTGADVAGGGRGTAGKIDITDVHLRPDVDIQNFVEATHTVFTRENGVVQYVQQQGRINPTTGVFEQGFLDTVKKTFTANAASLPTSGVEVIDADKNQINYLPMAGQRYVWQTQADYTLKNNFNTSSSTTFGTVADALGAAGQWGGATKTTTPTIYLLPGAYVSTGKIQTYTQEKDPVTGLPTGKVVFGEISNLDPNIAAETQSSYLVAKGDSTLTAGSTVNSCSFTANCTTAGSTSLYMVSTDLREITTHSLKADNPIKINFIGSSTGTINVTSKSDIVLQGNATNLTGTVSITSKEGSIIQSASSGSTINARVIELNAAGSVGGVGEIKTPLATTPVSVMLSSVGKDPAKLDAIAGNGVVSVTTLGALAVGQVTAANATLGKGSVTLFANGSITAVGNNSLIQADSVNLTSLAGTLGTMSKALNVNTGFTTDPAKRPFGDPAESKPGSLVASYGLVANAFGDINIKAGDWKNNTDANILANSIVSIGGDVKLTTKGQVLDGNPVEQLDKRTTDQLLSYWNALGLVTDSAENKAEQQAALAAFQRGQTQAYQQYWQFRLGQSDKGATYDPNYQVTYTPGTAAYDNLAQYYRVTLTVNNGGKAPADIEAKVAQSIIDQGIADTARYRELNSKFGSATASFDVAYNYQATSDEQASLAKGASWGLTALGFPLSAGALKTVTNTNPVIKAPNVSGRDVVILADGGIGETLTTAGARGVTVKPVTDPVNGLTTAQKIALATAERSDLQLNFTLATLTGNETPEQLAAYHAAVKLGLQGKTTTIDLGIAEAKMTDEQRAVLDAAAAGMFDRSSTTLTVLSKRPLNVTASGSFNASVTAGVTGNNSDLGKAYVASRGDMALGAINVTGETRIKAIGSLTTVQDAARIQAIGALTNMALPSFKTGNVVLESATGSIGIGGPVLLNLRDGATITARALNAVNLYSLAGSVGGAPDALIDTVYSTNVVNIRAAGSILNANGDRQINVLGMYVGLDADSGSIGSVTSTLNVGTFPNGTIRAIAQNGLINLYGVAGRDFTITGALAGTSATLEAAGDGTIAGPVNAGSDIAISAGKRLVIASNGNVVSAAGNIQASADSLKMLRGAQITAQLGSVRVSMVNNALVTGITAGSSAANAIDITSGGHLIAGSEPGRAFDLNTTAAGAGIRISAALGIGDVTQADIYAADRTGMAAGSANLITNVANPLIMRTNAIEATSTVGDVNLITLTDINAGSIFTGGGNIDVDARKNFRVSSITALRDAADERGHAVISAGGDIDVGTSRSTSMFAETPRAARFGDVTVDNPAIFNADVTEIGALHASGYKSTPLVFEMTGYRGSVGTSGRVYVDAPMGVVMPLLRENEADIRTNAIDYAIPDATIGRWMKFTAPKAVIWADNRTPRPVLGFDVQLFQPSKQFYLYQNGVRTFTNAAVVQYSERAEVIEWRNVLTMPGGSLVRDIDRIPTFTGVGSVLLRDDSPDYSGSFFRGDAFTHFMEALRDRGARRPLKGPVVNLKGLASTESSGD